MAILSSIKCEACGQNSHAYHSPGTSPPKICNACQIEQSRKNRKETLAKIAQLTTEERLRRIEEWIYDYKPPRSIHDMRL